MMSAYATETSTIDSVFNKIEEWSRAHPTLHYKITTTQHSVTNTDVIYQTTSSNNITITDISRTSTFPVSYTYQVRTLPDGSIIAIFPVTQRTVYIATKDEIDQLSYTFIGTIPNLSSGVRSISTNITHENTSNGHKLICTLDMEKLEQANLAEPMASQITLVIEADASGKITQTKLVTVGSADATSIYTYFSTPTATILSHINALPEIQPASISNDITYSEAIIDELNTIANK